MLDITFLYAQNRLIQVRFIYNKTTLLKFPTTKLISKVFNFTRFFQHLSTQSPFCRQKQAIGLRVHQWNGTLEGIRWITGSFLWIL